MPTYAITLRPRCALATPVTSDTLFGALCWGVRALRGTEVVTQLLNEFESSTPFALSSGFPCVWREGAEPLRFFPLPMLRELTSAQVNELAEQQGGTSDRGALSFKQELTNVIGRWKTLKKVGLVSESLFDELVCGDLDAAGIYDRYKNGKVEQIGNALMSRQERESFGPDGDLRSLVVESDAPGNSIDRVALATVEGQLFYRRGLSFREGVGLWFALHTEDIDYWKPVLRYVQDTGLGGDRSTGKGHFEFSTPQPVQLPRAPGPDAFVVLSRFIPRDGEVIFDGEPLRYKLHSWRGKLESRFGVSHRVYRQKRVRQFAEGSIFPLHNEPSPYFGRLVEVDKLADRTVYHCGVALAVAAKLGGGS